MAMSVQGAALTHLKQYAAAEHLLLGSLPGLKESPISDLEDKGRVRLQQLYLAWGKPGQASLYRKSSMSIGDVATPARADMSNDE
jgi:hypothetical protein